MLWNGTWKLTIATAAGILQSKLKEWIYQPNLSYLPYVHVLRALWNQITGFPAYLSQYCWTLHARQTIKLRQTSWGPQAGCALYMRNSFNIWFDGAHSSYIYLRGVNYRRFIWPNSDLEANPFNRCVAAAIGCYEFHHRTLHSRGKYSMICGVQRRHDTRVQHDWKRIWIWRILFTGWTKKCTHFVDSVHGELPRFARAAYKKLSAICTEMRIADTVCLFRVGDDGQKV